MALREREVVVVVVLGLIAWGWFDVRHRGRVDPRRVEAHKSDFTVYTTAGAAFFDGRDPYEVTNPRGWHYLYPPLFALMVAPLALLDTQTQVTVWFGLSVLLGFGCWDECKRLGRAVGGWPSWIAIAAGLAIIGPTFECLQRGQIGVALLYPMLVGFRWIVLERKPWSWFAGGVLLALPAVVKVVPALPVVMLLLVGLVRIVADRRNGSTPSRRWLLGGSGVALGVLLFLFVIPGALLGWKSNISHLTHWFEKVAANSDVARTTKFEFHSVRNQGLINAVHLARIQLDGTAKLGEIRTWNRRPIPAAYRKPPWPLTMPRAAVVVLLIATTVALARRGDDPLGLLMAFGLAGVAIFIVSPLAWVHYGMVQLPALLSVPLWLDRKQYWWSSRALAIAPAVASLAVCLMPKQAGAWGVLGLTTAAWFVAACLLAIHASRSRTRSAISAPASARCSEIGEEGGRHCSLTTCSTA